LRDAKIFVLEVHAIVLQPFDLSLTLSSDNERAQKVVARLEGEVAAWVAGVSPR
jgi:hypothetical protein